jgi:predicted HTH transcriptional regulator
MQSPGYYDLRIIEYENTPLLCLIIHETQDELKPCFNKQMGLPNGACIRVGNNDRVITDHEMRAFFRNSTVFKFDKTQAEDTRVALLDLEKISDFLNRSAINPGSLHSV